MSSDIIKDCGDIWNRLFDHRPFLSGEIKYFVEKFEGRGYRANEKLAIIDTWITEIEKTEIPKIVTSFLDFEKLQILVEIIQQNIDIVLEENLNEEEEEARIVEAVNLKKAERKVEWRCYSESLFQRRVALDKKYTDKEAQFREEYKALEDDIDLKLM